VLHVTQRWKEYTEDLYDRNNRLTDEEMKECVGPASKEDDPGPSLLNRQKLFRQPLFQEALFRQSRNSVIRTVTPRP